MSTGCPSPPRIEVGAMSDSDDPSDEAVEGVVGDGFPCLAPSPQGSRVHHHRVVNVRSAGGARDSNGNGWRGEECATKGNAGDKGRPFPLLCLVPW